MARRRRARVGKAPPSTPAQSAVTTGWLTAVIAEVLVIFPLYGWLASGGEPMDRFLAAYAPVLPFLGGTLLVGTLPLMIVASALARRFEAPLMRAPVLWAHLSGALVWVVLLILWVAWVGALDLADAGTRTWLIHSVLMILVATEAFLWRLRQR